MGWMKQVPTWMAGVIMAVMFAGAWFGATFITTPELGVGPRALLSIIVGAFYGIFMGIWVGRTRRAHGRVGSVPSSARLSVGAPFHPTLTSPIGGEHCNLANSSTGRSDGWHRCSTCR
ncbi:hypothetical protein [Curtobacterium sp. MCSS17_016]|uniref:hypothetical protein n=1 Tax=Curtobacterium sp. MCSS17_016 TaxID=2175644 RepID=UPI0011B85DA3|nr:hypothetical protein [Curtobacterium sp. MCSS17_016]WIE78435.1 hypothetical protein DEJ19_015255 [Curtobacterium sp. MCSS17_016]